jgi:hypothetical protein
MMDPVIFHATVLSLFLFFNAVPPSAGFVVLMAFSTGRHFQALAGKITGKPWETPTPEIAPAAVGDDVDLYTYGGQLIEKLHPSDALKLQAEFARPF